MERVFEVPDVGAIIGPATSLNHGKSHDKQRHHHLKHVQIYDAVHTNEKEYGVRQHVLGTKNNMLLDMKTLDFIRTL